MGGRPQKREKASGRKGWELGSTWNVKWTHVGIGFSGYVGTLGRVYVALVFRCPRFPLPSFSVGTLGRVYVGTGLRWNVGGGLRWKRGTLRGC